jgi:hypothetical protein
MKDYISRIKKIKKRYAISEKENFVAAPSGTNYKVFLSKSYVIRFRDDNPRLLLREADFLKQFNHPLMPKVLWSGEIDRLFFMVEQRLPGKTIDLVWRKLSTVDKKKLIGEIIDFFHYQRNQTKNYVYSVKTGKNYYTFCLSDGKFGDKNR